MELFTSFLSSHFNVQINCNGIEKIYIKRPYNDSLPNYLYDIHKPDSWINFAFTFFRSIDRRKAFGSNILGSGVELCSSINSSAFKFWEELYDQLGANVFSYIFKNNRLYYKINNAFVCLTCKSRLSKSCNYDAQFVNPIQKHCNYLGSYGDNRILKEKLLYHSTLKKWPRNSILYNSSACVEDVINQIYGIYSHTVDNAHSKCTNEPPPEIIKGLSKLLKVYKRNQFIKLYKKFDFENLVGELDKNKVLLFAKHVVMNYVPAELLGSRTHLFRLANFLRMVLKRNINQVTTVREAVLYIFPNKNEYLMIFKARLVDWLIHEYIFKILLMFFYFNLSPKNEIIVFTGRYWYNKENRMIKSLIKCCKLVRCNDEENEQEQCCSSIRFLPKPNGITFRFLVQNRNREQKAIMKNALIFIKQLTVKLKHRAGIKTQDLHSLWLDFYQDSKQSNKLYYLKTDIKDAYGSILLGRLNQILDREIDQVNGNILELITFHCEKIKFPKSVRLFSALPLILSGVVYEDPELIEVISKSHLRDVITDHINSVFVKLRNHSGLYKMLQGLPQGGQLSPVLSELYYTALDIEYLMEFHHTDFFVRLVDDYLFVSTSFERAKRFVTLMYSGFPLYNMKMEKAKSITNVGCEDLFHIPFFGHLIDTKRRTVEILLMSRMKNTSSLKLTSVLLDSTYNSEDVIISNLVFSCSLMALKYKALTELISHSTELSSAFLIKCAEIAIFFISKNAVKSCRELSLHCVKYIACRCFLYTLSDAQFYGVTDKLALLASRLSKKFNIDADGNFSFHLSKYIPRLLQTC